MVGFFLETVFNSIHKWSEHKIYSVLYKLVEVKSIFNLEL